jgi:DedD protein
MSLIVIFVPMLVEDEPLTRETSSESNIPPEPDSDLVEREFQAEGFEAGQLQTEELVPLGGRPSGDSQANSGTTTSEPAPPPLPAPADRQPVDEAPVAETPSSPTSSGDDDLPAVGEDVAAIDANEPADQQQEPTQDETSLEDLRRGNLKAWVVQVASFSNPKFAESLVADLREKGFAAFMEGVQSNGRTWYRVVVGPEVDKQRTKDLQNAIVKATKDERLRGAIKSYP